MTDHATAGSRLALMGLMVAGALAGTAGGASAQYYGYDDDGFYPPPPPYRSEYRYRDFGYRDLPPAPVPVSPERADRLTARGYGLVRIERSVGRGNIRIIDGVTADGRHLRLVLDAYSGDLLRRIALPGQPQPAPRIARIDPREEHATPRPRLTPKPPERPAALKPPVEASAPATAIPAPAARPPEPSPGSTDAKTGADKPKLVNPEDVRGIEEGERKPPIAAAQQVAPAPTPTIPPVQSEAPAAPKPETQIVPVAPLE